MGFTHAVNWSEDRWIFLIALFHIMALASVIYFKSSSTAQIILLLIFSLILYCLEIINEIAEQNWVLFSTQNYFDAHGKKLSFIFIVSGIFLGVCVAMPLLGIMGFQVLSALYYSAHLLVTVKKNELKLKKQ